MTNLKTRLSKIQRVGLQNPDIPRKILATVDCYETKILLLSNKIIITEDRLNDPINEDFEKLHMKFCKFSLGINRCASNWGIRAELGRYPIELYTNYKLIKYWYRLENLEYDQNSILSILSDAYCVCKNNNHNWSSDIKDLMDRNGLNDLHNNVQQYSELYILSSIKSKLEQQYIQSWDQKGRDDLRLSTMFNLKKNKYKYSSYLNDIVNIEDRKCMTRLRTGCSKLKTHRFLNKKETILCSLCQKHKENLEHTFLVCDDSRVIDIRKKFFIKVNLIYPYFIDLNNNSMIICLMNLKMFGVLNRDNAFTEICLNFMKEILLLR